ncbi:MAG: hypothetical protein ABW185_09665 [Sedimenticola sp.]
MKTVDINLHFHLLGESRYGVNCTLAVAHGCVTYRDVGEGREHGAVSLTTPCNRQKIAPAFSAYRPSMDINNYYASLCLALHLGFGFLRRPNFSIHGVDRKRTLHPVQLRILG